MYLYLTLYLLFNLFINDIEFLNSKTLLYADDMKIYRIITSSADNLLLQENLNRFNNCCTQNNL
ncbi:Reverse transcriptase domain-containing protein, partial [Aphis craccivora]